MHIIHKSILSAGLVLGLSIPAFGAGLQQFPTVQTTTQAQILNVAAPKIVPVPKGVKKYFQSHVYTGGRFTRRMAARIGLPNATIFDRRFKVGDVYTCSFITHRGKKAIVCD